MPPGRSRQSSEDISLKEPFDADELNKLPVRSQVAFAARCARRVRHLFKPGDQVNSDDEDLVEKAIQSAEYFATDRAFLETGDIAEEVSSVFHRLTTRGDWRKNVAARVASSAGFAAQAARGGRQTFTQIGDEAAAAARSMVEALSIAEPDRAEAAIRSARADLEALTALGSAQSSGIGIPVDPAEDGPLGPLWPK